MKKKYGIVVLLLLVSYLLVSLMASAMDTELLELPPEPTAEEIAEAEAQFPPLAELMSDEPEVCTGSTENLLANPGFEGAYSDYVPSPPIPDCPWGVCFSAQMASNWTPYWQSQRPGIDEGWEMLMPEYKPATSDFTNPVRVKSGGRAQQLFTFWGTHRAGIMQQVYNVEPGQNYCLSVWGHAWSGATDDPYTDPADHGFLNQSIGIDPFGGRDFTSPNIAWTSPTTQYDEYGLFKIEVEAQSDTLTVFFNSEPLWPKKHNDVYWDDAVLVRSGVAEPPVMIVDPTWSAFTAETAVPVITSAEVNVVIENNRDNLWYQADVLNTSAFTPTVTILGEKMTLDIDSTGLPAGLHRATIEVSASDASIDGGRQYVTIEVDVAQSAPEVKAMGTSFAVIEDVDTPSVTEGSIEMRLLNTEQLVNPAWSATLDQARSEFTPTMTNTWGTDGESITFSVDSTGFEVGSYTAWVDIRGNDASFVNVVSYPITLVVAEDISRVYTPVIFR